MVLRFFMLAGVFLFLSCVSAERDNPNDPGSDNYRGYQVIDPPSSSKSSSSSYVAPPTIPSSSSSKPSSSSYDAPPPPPPSSSSSVLSSSSVAAPSSSSVGSVPNGGKGNDISKYKTKQIGTQTWMAENLDYNVSGSKCYYNIETNCTTYGRLYDWATAMALPAACNTSSCKGQITRKHKGICPTGWHIPSDAEWNTLMRFVNPNCSDNNYVCADVGTKLKATSGWNDYNGRSGNGEDTYEFAALPGGGGYSDGSFYSVGYNGYWCSATEIDASYAYYRYMYYYTEDVYRNYTNKSNSLFSVRCLQD